VNPLHNQVGFALKESSVWNELSIGHETLGPGLHLLTKRQDGDHSPELLMQYRRSIADPADIVVHYTEQIEEDCNEGLHDLHHRTWNLLRFLNEQIPSFAFDLDQGIFVPVVKGKELAPAKAWMFARD
jgi:hypothetical protein